MLASNTGAVYLTTGQEAIADVRRSVGIPVQLVRST